MLSKHTLSPLSFNCCQFGTPLNSSYVPLLIGPIRHCFGHFFFYNKFLNLKKKKKKTDIKKKKKKPIISKWERSLQQDFLTLSLKSCHLNAATRDHQQEKEYQMSSPSPPPTPIRRRLVFFATGSTTAPSMAPAPTPAQPRALFA